MAAEKILRAKYVVDDSQLKSSIKNSQSAVQQFKAGIMSIAPAIVAAFAVRALINFSKVSLKAYQEQIRAEAKLQTSLDGRQPVIDSLISQAKELQKVTFFRDEDIINAQAILALFVKEEKQLKELTPLVLDLAQAKGLDLASAATMVGKATVGVMRGLKGVGITMDYTGDRATMITAVIEELTRAVQGHAKNALTPQEQKLREVAVATDELREAWGKLVLGLSDTGVTSTVSTTLDIFRIALEQIDKTKGWERISEIIGLLTGGAILNQQYYVDLADSWERIAKGAKNWADALARAKGNENFVTPGAGGGYPDPYLSDYKVPQSLADLRAKLKDYQEQREKASFDEIKALNLEIERIDAKIKAYEKLGLVQAQIRVADMSKMTGQASTPTTIGTIEPAALGNKVYDWTAFFDTNGLAEVTSTMQMSFHEVDEGLANFAANVVENTDMITNAFQSIGYAFGNALGEFAKGEAKFSDVVFSLLGDIIKIIAGYLAQSVASSIAGGASVGGPAAPFTGAAAGAAMLSIFASLVPALLAEGGVVPAGFPGDTYPARLTSGEMVIPPHKLDSVMGGRYELFGEWIMRGQDMALIVNKQNSKAARYR